jgi:hypothetical protein
MVVLRGGGFFLVKHLGVVVVGLFGGCGLREVQIHKVADRRPASLISNEFRIEFRMEKWIIVVPGDPVESLGKYAKYITSKS